MTHPAYELYLKGCYSDEVTFWDEVLDTGRAWPHTNKAMRQALYPVFGKAVKLLGDFELEFFVRQMLKGNILMINAMKKALVVREKQRWIYDRKKKMDGRFDSLFGLAEVKHV